MPTPIRTKKTMDKSSILNTMKESNLSYVPPDGETLLYCAVELQAVDAARYFVGNCTDSKILNAKTSNTEGLSALHLAAILAINAPTQEALEILRIIANTKGVGADLKSGHESSEVQMTAKQFFTFGYEKKGISYYYIGEGGNYRKAEDAAKLYDDIVEGRLSIKTSDEVAAAQQAGGRSVRRRVGPSPLIEAVDSSTVSPPHHESTLAAIGRWTSEHLGLSIARQSKGVKAH